MTPQWHAIILVGALAVSWLLTAMARRYALATELIDRPNDRSSHSVPTPRGGGVAIVISFLIVTAALAWAGTIERSLMVAMLGAGTLVATLGFADDRWTLPARWRFLGHAVAACWVLWWMGPLPAVPVFGIPIDLGVAGVLVSVLYVIWMVNLFNFMDGIDGIASIEAITVSLGGALVWWLGAADSQWWAAVMFAACVGGFLAWNFPPARIFMGDAGSGFLGMMVATMSLWCGRDTPSLFWSWFILLGCFMVDATTTLVRRVRRGERFHEAHRSHAYQYAARRHGSHTMVSVAVGVINLLWLLPLAVLVALGVVDGVAAVLVAYAPLVVLAFKYKAGCRADQEI